MEEQDRTLSALDATFLELEEADESAHMHIGGVMIVEAPSGEPPSLGAIRREIQARLGDLPRYTQRLSETQTGGLRWPRWEEDPAFRIANHVYAAGLPSPAGIGELTEWAGEYFSVRLDRRRPLWEMVVLELGDGRRALVSKTHHCLVDGVGSVDAAKTLLDLEPDPEPVTRPRDAAKARSSNGATGEAERAGRLPTPRSLAAGALRRSGDLLGAAASGARRAADVIGQVRDPHRIAEAVRQADAVARLIVRDEIGAAPSSSINEQIGTHRRLAVVSVSLERLKEIRGGLGGTVNDVVLAACAGGLRRLLTERGDELPDPGLRAMVPVNIRPAADHLSLGNRVSSLFVHLPVAESEPLARYRSQLEEAEGLKSSTQALGSQSMIELMAMAPPVLHSFVAQSLFATRLFNLTITNVPGPQQPLYALGSRVQEIWPLVPLAASHALGIAVLSYDGHVCFCVNADHDSCPDLEVLRAGIEAELDVLAELAAQRVADNAALSSASR